MFPFDNNYFIWGDNPKLILTATNYYMHQISIDLRETEWNTYKVVLQRPSIYQLELEPLLDSMIGYKKVIKCVRVLTWHDLEQTKIKYYWDCYSEKRKPIKTNLNIAETKEIIGYLIPYEDFLHHIGETPPPKPFRFWAEVSLFEDEIPKEKVTMFLEKIIKNKKILDDHSQDVKLDKHPSATYDPFPTQIQHYEIIVNLHEFKAVYYYFPEFYRRYINSELIKRGIDLFSEEYFHIKQQLTKKLLPKRVLLLESLVEAFLAMTAPVSNFFTIPFRSKEPL